MATYRHPPGRMRRRPARSWFDRLHERVHGPMVHRMTPFHYLEMLDTLGVDTPWRTSTECAENLRRYGRAARAQIERQRHAALQRYRARRGRPRLPRARARGHRIARRTAVKSTADPDGPAPRAPLAHDPRGAP